MKGLIAIIAVAMAITSPALAKSQKQVRQHVSPGIYGSAVVPTAPAQRSFGNPSWNVEGARGGYVGSNTDAAIRIEDQNLRYGGHY